MPDNRYLGAGVVASLAMKLLGRNILVPYPVGLERDGKVLLKPFCPPFYASMAEAVRAVAETKFGAKGIFRDSETGNAWLGGQALTAQIPPASECAVAAATAYCEYLWRRYGRFPVHLAPYRTVLGFQACHLDAEFYDRFYRPEALSPNQRADFENSLSSREAH
jgi:hypothetical protein